MAASERRCLLGGPGTGKTSRLVECAAGLLEAGAAPGDVLVVAAGPAARATFAARLAERAGEAAAARVRVETPRTLELGLLDCDAARAHTGRRARLLRPFEVNALLEDVKTSGLRPGRLKQMLKFFYRGWTELAETDPAWLVTDEERGVYQLLKECLAFSGGIMEAELAGLAVGWLRADSVSLAAVRVPHVLADDFQMLNRASQTLTEMLASASLMVAGDPYACVEVCDPYPSAAGLETFARAEGVTVERLGACGRGGGLGDALMRLRGAIDVTDRAVAAERAEEELLHRARREMRTPDEQRAFEAERGRGDACGNGRGGEEAAAGARSDAGVALTGDAPAGIAAADGAPARIDLRVHPTAADEACAVAASVREALAGGMRPQDVFVAAPTRGYAASVRRALTAGGIACARTAETRFLAADIRDLRRCTVARALTLLALAADPTDDVAWRSWCGFGDWLANSPGFAALRRLAACEALPMHDLLERLARDGVLGRNRARGVLQSLAADERASLMRVLDAYAAARDALGGLAGLEGRPLVEKAVRCVVDSGERPEAEADVEGALHAVLELTGSRDDAPISGVRVGTLEEAAGCAPRLMLVVGLVDGLLPGKDYFDEVQSSPLHRLQVLAGDQRRLYAALGSCRGDVRLAGFERMEQAAALRMGLRVRRIRAVGGEPFAYAHPSVVLGELGLGLDAVSGEEGI